MIDNHKYFENLKHMHAWNYLGTCTIVSTEILLGYFDAFYSDNFIDESYDVITSEYISSSNYSWQNFSQSPGADNHYSDDHDFHDYLVDIARDEVGDDPEVNGMTAKNQLKLVTNYLDKRNISYEVNSSVGNLSDIWFGNATKTIKSGIANNRPVIANGTNHSVVAYAYDDEYVWVHTGWGYIAATPWETYESNFFSNYSAGCIDIVYDGEHEHSDNYYAYNKNEFICTCSVKFVSTTVSPEDYGFEAQYFFYSKSKTIALDNLEINTKRLRTGYIENEYVNLSPKRENAGSAYLELKFNKSIRKFSINLSYWQILDKLSQLDSLAVLEVKKGNRWYFTENLISANLSVDRSKQDVFTYSYIGDEIDGIAIRVTAPAVGDRNLGRISIGNLTLIHD